MSCLDEKHIQGWRIATYIKRLATMKTKSDNFIESYRRESIKQIFKVSSFSNSWAIWKNEINIATKNFSDPTLIFKLGQNLAEIFSSTKIQGRAQSSLSGGGTAWECLVCWYMNTVLAGSRAVVIRPTKQLVPNVIRDATCIVYGNAQTNTESDLLTIVFPRGISGIAYTNENLQDIVVNNARDITVGVIQCKTNWNDNAQIPMLWDMVYRADGFLGQTVRVGRNGYTPNHFKDFSYSFVTVPSQVDLSKFKPDSMSVKRVRGLTGGNYWGHPTKSDVALSLTEIFNRNFSDGFDDNIISHITKALTSGVLDISTKDLNDSLNPI